MTKPHENHREDVAGRANVEDTPELLAYYRQLDAHSTGALWTVANKIEPWQPQSQSVPVVWRYNDLRAHVLRSLELVTPEKAGRRVIYLNNPGRTDVAAAVGWWRQPGVCSVAPKLAPGVSWSMTRHGTPRGPSSPVRTIVT